MSFRNERDAHVFALRGIEISVHVAVRIHHDRHAGFLAADQIAGLREPIIVKTLQKHAGEWLAKSMNATRDCLMRLRFPALLLLIAFGSRANAQTTETPVPFDSAGRVT